MFQLNTGLKNKQTNQFITLLFTLTHQSIYIIQHFIYIYIFKQRIIT